MGARAASWTPDYRQSTPMANQLFLLVKRAAEPPQSIEAFAEFWRLGLSQGVRVAGAGHATSDSPGLISTDTTLVRRYSITREPPPGNGSSIQ
jgi:hypothetical protein